MANLPSQHPDLAIHLTDRALTPLISSARTKQHIDALTTLAHTALSAHESAHRLGLGPPQRIIVEHGEGPVLLQAFLSPRAPVATPTPTATTVTTPLATQEDHSAPALAASPSNSTTAAAAAANGGTAQSPPSPAQNTRQHQGALALAAESRGTAAAAPTTAITTTTTTAYLRGGAAPDDDKNDDHHHNNHNNNNQPLGYGGQHPLFLADDADPDDEDENPDAPPMLVGIVVAASSDATLEARRAAARLEHVGREIQGQWSEMQGQGQSSTPRQEDAAAD
ncbi:hypothetical protein F5B17DRAFT_345363 [Nemania serpens]|nr:hypothetical protein F5B17DRAFT_345363 [Nemania serpens]